MINAASVRILALYDNTQALQRLAIGVTYAGPAALLYAAERLVSLSDERRSNRGCHATTMFRCFLLMTERCE